MNAFDLPAIAIWLTKNKLMTKSFCDMSREEIEAFCEEVHNATDPVAGYVPPYLNEKSELIIPVATPKKYKWWAGGQTIKETLQEIGAPVEIIKRYCDPIA